MRAHVNKDCLLAVDRADGLDHVCSLEPDSERVDEGLEHLLELFILDSEESGIEATEEYEDAGA